MAAQRGQAQPSEAQRQFFQDLVGPNFAVTQSIYAQLHKANNGDADRITDELMHLTHDPLVDERRRKAAEEEQQKAEADAALRDLWAKRQVEEAQRKRVSDEQAAEGRRKEDQERRRREAEERKRFEDEQRQLESEFQRRVEEERKRRAEETARKQAAAGAAEDDARRKKEAAAAASAKQEEERRVAELERRVRETVQKEKDEAEVARRRREADAASAVAAAAAADAARKQRDLEEAEKKRNASEQSKRAAAEEQSEAKRRDEEVRREERRLEEMRVVYERKFQELEARLTKFEQASSSPASSSPASISASGGGSSAAKKDVRTGSGSSPALAVAETPPKVCVLINDGVAPARLEEVVAYLTSKAGVKADEIKVVNAANDFDLLAIVKGQRQEEVKFPLVLMHNAVIGSLDDVKQCAERGLLPEILAGQKAAPSPSTAAAASASTPSPSTSKKSGPPPAELQLSLLDHTLAFTSGTVKTVGTLVFLPIIAPYKLVSWAFGSRQTELEKGEDVDVIQSNWYWRHQLRTMRFTEQNILRLRPGYEDVRALHKYEDVKEIRLEDATHLVISYHSGGSDYLRTTPDSVLRICELISKRSKSPPTIIQPATK